MRVSEKDVLVQYWLLCETVELSAEEPKEVASAGLAADDEDEEEEEDTPVEDVAPAVDEKIREAVANTVQKEDVVIEEGEPMNRWVVDENDNDADVATEEKKPEQELSVEEAAELQKQLEAALKKRNAKDVKTRDLSCLSLMVCSGTPTLIK